MKRTHTTDTNAELLAALATFDPDSMFEAARDMIDGIQLQLDDPQGRISNTADDPENLILILDRTRELVRMAWLLKSPHMAKAIARLAHRDSKLNTE